MPRDRPSCTMPLTTQVHTIKARKTVDKTPTHKQTNIKQANRKAATQTHKKERDRQTECQLGRPKKKE